MNILIVHNSVIPPVDYGGTERVIWFLGKELAKLGHKVTYLAKKGSNCEFAQVLFINPEKSINDQIPEDIDIIHFHAPPQYPVLKPYLVTIHGNVSNFELDINSVFVSRDHATRFGSESFVYNGIDWDYYPKPELENSRTYFHFLGNAAWRVKNLKGAIDVISATNAEQLKVLGGYRLNFKMGFRLTLSRRVSFEGMVAGKKKIDFLQNSKGLVFPVRWHEPFGLAIIESLYMGCPVFGTPYGSLPELVNPTVGFLADNQKKLTEALKNVSSFSRLTCHEYAVDMFNSKKMAEGYLEKYQKVLNGQMLNTVKPRLQHAVEKFLAWK